MYELQSLWWDSPDSSLLADVISTEIMCTRPFILTLTSVSVDLTKVTFFSACTMAILASSRANLMPMQFLGPCPNGMNTNGSLLAFSSCENLQINICSNKHCFETLNYQGRLRIVCTIPFHWDDALISYGFPDMGRITLESNALNYHYLPKMCIELPLPLLDFVKVMHWISIIWENNALN